jgi:4-amino-4-deoxy-L-arabinose transferase-like glycosyltransferase
MFKQAYAIFKKPGYEYFALLVILLLTFALRLFFINEPLDRDEGTYFLLGKEILRGAVPYRDAIEMKLPGSFYLFALFMLVGDSVRYIRIITVIYSLLTVTATYLLARSVGGRWAGLFAALLCGIFTSGPVVQGSGSNLEVFLLFPMMVGVYLLLRGFNSGSRLYLSLSGLFLAFAVLIKTVVLPVYFLPILFIPFVQRSQQRWMVMAKDVLAYVTPGVLLSIVLVVYLSLNDAWNDFVYWNVTYASSYAKTPWTLFWDRLVSRGLSTANEFLVLWIVAFLTIFWLIVKQRSLKNLFLIGMLVATIIGVCMPGKFWPHYLIILIPPLSVISGVGLATLFDKRRKLFYASLPLLAITLYPTIQLDYPYYAASPDEASRMKFGSDVFVAARDVAIYVKERTTPDDTIFQWGWEPEIYVTAQRRPPNRFLSHMIVADSPNPEAAVN